MIIHAVFSLVVNSQYRIKPSLKALKDQIQRMEKAAQGGL